MQVSLGLLHESVKDNTLVITHQPRFQKRGPKRKEMPSHEIRYAIEMNSSPRKKFALVILLNKYDVFAMVREKVLIQPAVQEIENLGEMIVVCATAQQRLTDKDVTRTVAPPHTLIRFPLTYAVTEILHSAATFGPVQSHQLFQQSGILLIKYQAVSSARASYGATLPGPVYFTSCTPDNDILESLDQRLRTVALSDLPAPAFNEVNLAVAGTTAPLAPFQPFRPSPVPSVLPEASAPVSPGSDTARSDGSFLQPLHQPH